MQLRNLDLFLENQIKRKPGSFNFASFGIVRGRNVPRQQNLYDCGVFVILFMMNSCKLDSRSFVVSRFHTKFFFF